MQGVILRAPNRQLTFGEGGLLLRRCALAPDLLTGCSRSYQYTDWSVIQTEASGAVICLIP
jgi:hypothetical protein